MLAADKPTAAGGDERLPASDQRQLYCAHMARAGQRHMARPDRASAGAGVGLLRLAGPGAGLYRALCTGVRAAERCRTGRRVVLVETGDERLESDESFNASKI